MEKFIKLKPKFNSAFLLLFDKNIQKLILLPNKKNIGFTIEENNNIKSGLFFFANQEKQSDFVMFIPQNITLEHLNKLLVFSLQNIKNPHKIEFIWEKINSIKWEKILIAHRFKLFQSKLFLEYIINEENKTKYIKNSIDFNMENSKIKISSLLDNIFTDSLDCEDKSYKDNNIKPGMDFLNFLETFKAKKRFYLSVHKNKEIIGLVILNNYHQNIVDLDYIGILPKYRGKGLITEVIKEVIFFCYKQKFTKITAETDLNNFPMIQAFKKTNFYKTNKKKIFIRNI